MNKLKEQIEEILMEYMKEYPATDVGVSCSALAGRIVHELTPQVGEIGKMLAYENMANTDNRRRSFPPPESDEWLSYHDKEVNRKLDTIVTLLTPQVDGVSRDALYIGAEIRWAGMTPLERAEAIGLGWHPSNYLKEIKE